MNKIIIDPLNKKQFSIYEKNGKKPLKKYVEIFDGGVKFTKSDGSGDDGGFGSNSSSEDFSFLENRFLLFLTVEIK